MTDEIPIGPNSCQSCGGEYGEHTNWCESNNARLQQFKTEATETLAVVDVIAALRSEIDRLKAGDFTPEEFQNLCHKFSEADKCAFYQGCEEYQRKLFGESDLDRFKKALMANL